MNAATSSSPLTPRAGDAVRYVSADGQIKPATVEAVNGDGTLTLNRGSGPVAYDAGRKAGTWHWPASRAAELARAARAAAAQVVEHKETKETEAEPAPVEPAPVEPAPVEPAPVEPAPVEPAARSRRKNPGA